MISSFRVYIVSLALAVLGIACTAGDAAESSGGSGAGSLGNEQKGDSSQDSGDAAPGIGNDSVGNKPEWPTDAASEPDAGSCEDPHYPLDGNNPYEQECWGPPWSYCANGCYGAGSRACSPDGSVCCQFACSCVPCGWKHCLCSGGPSAECEESGCGPVTENAPACEFDPMSSMTDPKPMICWDGLVPPR
ncbi:MAG: hypothetical protein HUU55_18765 [Myxococcales bacterium]|nr:hypothetical protein [Myxococcales bacterium]